MEAKRVLLFVCMLLAAGYASAADRVKGNGKLTSKKIEVADYNAVKIDGVIDFYYEQSNSQPYLEVTVDENLHDFIHIDIKDRLLTVGFKGAKVDHYTKFIVKTNSKWLREARVSGNARFLVNSRLTGDEVILKAASSSLIQIKEPVKAGRFDLEASDNAKITTDKLEADKLECYAGTSAVITLQSGKASEGNYTLSSGGQLHAFGIAVSDLKCKMTGNSLAEIHPTDRLNANLMGKGKILYKGPTAVSQRIIGKGTIEEVK